MMTTSATPGRPGTPLTPARRAVLAIGIPVVLGLIGLFATGWGRLAVNQLASGEQAAYSVRLSAPASGGQSRLTISNADLTLGPGAGHRIQIRGSLLGSLVRPSFGHRSTARGLILSPTCRTPVGNCSLSFSATVPAGLAVTASDNFGNLTASGLRGRVSLSDNSGDLAAAGLTGTIRLANAYGSLSATRLAGSVQLTCNSGDINGTQLSGDVTLHDTFGGVTITGLAGAEVTASDNNGDIFLRFTKVPRQVDVSDQYGNITVLLPPGSTAYQIHAPAPQFGSRAIQVAQSPASSHVITAHNSNGDITIGYW
jgi:Putative adhesin